MKPVHWGVVTLLGIVGFAFGALLSVGLLSLGRTPLMITPWLGLFFLVLAGALLLGGREVRKLKARESTRITAIQASRVALFARSALLNSPLFTGFLAAVAVVGLFRLYAPATASSALGAGVGAAGALVFTIVAAIVERWCVDDSGEDWEKNSEQPDTGLKAAGS